MYQLSFSEFIQKSANQAGIVANWLDPSLVSVSFQLSEDRKQTVYIRPLGTDGADNLIVGFFSPALKLSSEQMIGPKMANELLRTNSQLFHGAWAILTMDDGDYLVASDTQIAQTMESEEFRASTLALAIMADSKEQELTGTDVFK